MTIKELKQKIENLPDNMEVFLAQRKTDFGFGLANSVYVKEIFFTEDEFPTEEEIEKAPKENVFVLDEE